MPRKYVQKNPYFKNSRLSIEQTEWLVFMYLKGVKASQCADFLGISHVSIGKLYKRLDQEMRSAGFFISFTNYLEDHDEDALNVQLHTIRGMLMNLNHKRTEPFEDWEIEFKLYTPHLAYLHGDGDFYPNRNNLNSCIKWCETDTPPLVVRKMIDDGKLNEVRNKRLSCENCPLRLRDIYQPPQDSRKFFCKEGDEKSIVYEPNFVFQNDVREIIVMWVEILWFLGHIRKMEESDFFAKIMHGAYFSVLKRGEYKISSNLLGAGINIPSPFLYPEQKESVENGFRFSSMLDYPAVYCMLDALKGKTKRYGSR